ncbi:MAG TPA: terpene cyclase/mutase family protein [Pirellulaceae bacterium]|nr:terpene cyclase/mutase family protein [Pirellulaceae bacterium]HMO91028.1 terpene cyclase/mutase family protein [Pirellulaceae bacterium]HMP68143.1 terpene cyclase/mutase family protein [Pirellulaceae bacterium]
MNNCLLNHQPDQDSRLNHSASLPDRRTLLLGTAATLGSMACAARTWGANSSSENDYGFVETTDESRRSVELGNAWLIKALNTDGGAGLDLGTTSDVACTSVVGMAFMSQGITPLEGLHRGKLVKLTEFLLRRVESMTSNGALQPSRSQIEGDLGPYATHFFSTMYLSQAMGETQNIERLQKALGRLSKYISSNQLKDGSWGTNAWAPMLATACGWLSLRSANFSGVSVSGSSEKAGQYMIQNMPRLGGNWGSGSWYHRLYDTAAGLRVLYSLGRDQETKAQQALRDILNLVESSNKAFGGAGGEEYLTFQLMTEMLMQKGGRDWQRWYPTVRDKLIAVQNKDGSWTGHHCITSRTFSTAYSIMVLTAPNRYLPISQV